MRTEDEQALVERYLAGANVRDLATHFAVALQTIYNVLERRGVEKRSAGSRAKRENLIAACRNGAVVSRVAEQLGISESTATRALRIERRAGETLLVPRGRPARRRAQAINAGRAILGVPFPYPQITKEKVAHELAKLRAHEGHLDEAGVMLPRSLAGVKLCAVHFPNRYRARYAGQISAFDAWSDSRIIQRAIQFQIRHGDPTTPERVLRALTLMCRTPSVFRPAVAKFIYERYCPRGGVAWDPCAGFGGRLLGAHAADVRYVGTDVDAETIEGNRRLAAVTGSAVDLHLCPAENFDPPPVDFVFTSPPYFDRERYVGDDQSWLRYRTVDLWCAKFLGPVMERAWRALSSGGHLALNIADLRKRGTLIPLVSLTLDAAKAVGFTHTETLTMPLASIRRHNPTEPVLVFRKL